MAMEGLPFKVWKLDTKVRPCFGTREKDESKTYRCNVSEAGTEIQRRVIAILETLKRVDIPLNIGAMTYSNWKWMNSKDGFHIKYAMPPGVFLEKYWPAYYEEEKSELLDAEKKPEIGDLQKSFEIDYYGKYLHSLCDYAKTDAKVVKLNGDLCIVRANDSLLKYTGPVVLWKRETLTCAQLKDEHLRDFEKAIVSFFGAEGLPGMKVENFGFSVCIFVTEHNKSEPASRAKICIGAKIDEERFIETIGLPKEMKESFLSQHEYEEKNIKYQKKFVNKDKKFGKVKKQQPPPTLSRKKN